MRLVLSHADMDRSLGTIELRPCLEQIERGVERRCAQRVRGRLIVAAAQPGAKAWAAHRPGLTMPADCEVGISDAYRGVKQISVSRQIDKHLWGRPYAGVPSPPAGGNF
jgi:hypothetical protein